MRNLFEGDNQVFNQSSLESSVIHYCHQGIIEQVLLESQQTLFLSLPRLHTGIVCSRDRALGVLLVARQLALSRIGVDGPSPVPDSVLDHGDCGPRMRLY